MSLVSEKLLCDRVRFQHVITSSGVPSSRKRLPSTRKFLGSFCGRESMCQTFFYSFLLCSGADKGYGETQQRSTKLARCKALVYLIFYHISIQHDRGERAVLDLGSSTGRITALEGMSQFELLKWETRTVQVQSLQGSVEFPWKTVFYAWMMPAFCLVYFSPNYF